MNVIPKIISGLAIVFFAHTGLYAQTATIKKDFIFSAIRGTESKPDSVILPATTKYVDLLNGDTAFFKILSGINRNCIVLFKPSDDFTGIAKSKLQSKSATGKLIAEINLTGLSMKGLEGENEPPLSKIIDALGYSINIGWTGLSNNCLPPLQGEELSHSVFQKAGKGKVEMIPVARYSPDFEVPFGFYTRNDETILKQQAGILSAKNKYPEHQTLFPSIKSGSKSSFDPGNSVFGFYATGPDHTGYSEDVWNMLLHPANAVHATRIYPVKDVTGKILKNSYLVCFEEAKNGDYNDYVFLVKNITPVTKDPFITLFNEKNFDGWDTFLRNIGTNKDPGNNFRIEDGSLHVIGKDLGYLITKKGYRNYHFKVDFKWGKEKWPPRENEKRDAGICYNIPMNEPDSIWPQSIECQVQEGDTGDFWLLSLSTIKVNGIQNIPANHTRMVKQKDAEKPTGEWNTVEVISYNGKCVHIVNDVVVNVGEEASIKEGRVLLQSEYAEIYYRNVKIREL